MESCSPNLQLAAHANKSIVEQTAFEPIGLALGNYAYVTQGDGLIVIEPGHAQELADRLTAWARAWTGRL